MRAGCIQNQQPQQHGVVQNTAGKEDKVEKAGQEKTVEGFKCPADKLVPPPPPGAEIQRRKNAMTDLGSAKMYN